MCVCVCVCVCQLPMPDTTVYSKTPVLRMFTGQMWPTLEEDRFCVLVSRIINNARYPEASGDDT